MTISVIAGRGRRVPFLGLLWGVFSALIPLCSFAAGTVAVAIDPSPGTDVIVNYNIYYGAASALYTNVVAVGTNTTVSISNLVGGATYYFAATAVDTFGLESVYATEVSALIPTAANRPPTEIVLAPITVVALPDTRLRFLVGSSLATNGQVTFSLDPGALVNAQVDPTNGLFVWNVTRADARTTNYFTVRITDMTSPSQQEVQQLVVIVQDFLELGLGAAATEGGQNVSLPLTVTSSGGVANLVFAVQWPEGRFTNATLSVIAPEIASGTLQRKGTNLLVRVKTLPGQAISGSTQIAQLNFQAVAGQRSAFVPLAISHVAAATASGDLYQNYIPRNGEVVVVDDAPLLRGAQSSGLSRSLTLFGKVGLNHELQYNTNGFSAAAWYPVMSYLQTNVAQTVDVTSSSPMIFYRLVAH